MQEPVTIGNGQAFWGDAPDGAIRLVQAYPSLDYLTLDYLSEVSLSIMAVQQEQDASRGYAADFVEVIAALAPIWQAGSKLRVIANAGGLNPVGCGRACAAILQAYDLSRPLKISVVAGDDVLEQLKRSTAVAAFRNLDDDRPLSDVQEQLVTANVYLGAMSLVDALRSGADIVITGRVADPSLTVAPCIYHYAWAWDDYDKIAGATVAGHLIECGTQVTGGCSTNWLALENVEAISFPMAEVYADGRCVITKPPGSGGAVTVETVTEQLLYEIGDPADYRSPDVRVSLLDVTVVAQGPHRVSVEGARGSPAPSKLKVSATYRDGFKAEAYLTLFGKDAAAKAKRCGQVLLSKLEQAGARPQRYLAECLGSGAAALGLTPELPLSECVLRICAADPLRATVERFSKEVASLVTCGPQGVTGYSSGRPTVRPIFSFWPCLIEGSAVYPILTNIKT